MEADIEAGGRGVEGDERFHGAVTAASHSPAAGAADGRDRRPDPGDPHRVARPARPPAGLPRRPPRDRRRHPRRRPRRPRPTRCTPTSRWSATSPLLREQHVTAARARSWSSPPGSAPACSPPPSASPPCSASRCWSAVGLPPVVANVSNTLGPDPRRPRRGPGATAARCASARGWPRSIVAGLRARRRSAGAALLLGAAAGGLRGGRAVADPLHLPARRRPAAHVGAGCARATPRCTASSGRAPAHVAAHRRLRHRSPGCTAATSAPASGVMMVAVLGLGTDLEFRVVNGLKTLSLMVGNVVAGADLRRGRRPRAGTSWCCSPPGRSSAATSARASVAGSPTRSSAEPSSPPAWWPPSCCSDCACPCVAWAVGERIASCSSPRCGTTSRPSSLRTPGPARERSVPRGRVGVDRILSWLTPSKVCHRTEPSGPACGAISCQTCSSRSSRTQWRCSPTAGPRSTSTGRWPLARRGESRPTSTCCPSTCTARPGWVDACLPPTPTGAEALRSPTLRPPTTTATRTRRTANQVFLRHYCVHLAGPDPSTAFPPFPADARAARGFNGDLDRHLERWQQEFTAGTGSTAELAVRAARKTLLAAAGLVSVHDHTWTTDRTRACQRWVEIEPSLAVPLALLQSWADGKQTASRGELEEALGPDGVVASVVARFASTIGLWSDAP